VHRVNTSCAGVDETAYTADGVRWDEVRPGSYDPKARLADMDVDMMVELLNGKDHEGQLHWAPLRDSLKLHVQMRAESIAAQARLEHELEIAASIQSNQPGRASSGFLIKVTATIAATI